MRAEVLLIMVPRAPRTWHGFALLLFAAGTAHAGFVDSNLIFFDTFATGNTATWTSENLTGIVRDYWTGAALAGASIVSTSPAKSDTSNEFGGYRLLDLAPSTSIEPLASRTAYRSTRNGPIALTGVSKSGDLFLMAAADINRQYVALGQSATAGLGIVIAELRRPDDSPLEGIVLADVQLTDASETPIGLGPYFIGSSGDVDSNLFISTSFGGRARVAFLNVPITAATLTVVSVEPGVGGEVTFAPVADGGNSFVLGGAD